MSEQTRAYLVLALMPLFFSSNLVIGRAAIEIVEPWTLGFWRWGLACAVLLPFTWSGLMANRAALTAQAWWILLLGFFGMVLCGGGVYVALRYTTATNGTLIYTASPVFVILLEAIFRGQKVSPRQVIGIALAFVGVAVIVLKGEIEQLIHLDLNPGDIGFAGAAAAWAIYSVVLKRPALRALPTMPLFAAIVIAGSALLLPAMGAEIAVLDTFPTAGRAWVSMLALAILSSLIPFLLYQYGVKVVGPTITSIYLYLLPVYGVAMAVVFLGEQLHAYHAVGFVLVSGGVILATAPAGRRAPAPAA